MLVEQRRLRGLFRAPGATDATDLDQIIAKARVEGDRNVMRDLFRRFGVQVGVGLRDFPGLAILDEADRHAEREVPDGANGHGSPPGLFRLRTHRGP